MKKDFWDKTFSEGRDFTILNELLLDKILNRINLIRKSQSISTPLKDVLDLGAGTGDTCLKFARRGLRPTLADISSVALDKAKERFNKEGLSENAEFVAVDFEDEQERAKINGHFDIVIMKLAIAFIKDKTSLLSWLKTLLNSGGVFILMTPVLLPEIEYDRRLSGISVGRGEIENLLKSHFKDTEILNEEYFEEKGLMITYLAY